MTPRAAVAGAFTEHRRKVESVAASILRDSDEARDIAGDTFLAMLEKGPDSSNDRAVLAWLLTSARNKAKNRARDLSRAARRAVHAVPEECAEDPGVGRSDAAALVVDASMRLNERDRRALWLRHVDELSYEDLARALRVGVSQAHVIVHRATKRLRRETVALIAERHGIDQECARELIARPGATTHSACRPCTIVLDEVAALTASGLLPAGALPLAHRVAQRFLTGPAHALLAANSERIGSMLAVLALSASVVAAGDGPALSPSSQEPPVAAALGAAVDRTMGADAVGDRSVVEAGALGGGEGVWTDPKHIDPAPLTPGPLSVPLIGALHLKDPLDKGQARGTDIRSFTVSGIRRGGALAGLRFEIGLFDGPDEEVDYNLEWAYGDRCAITITGRMWNQAWASGTCFDSVGAGEVGVVDVGGGSDAWRVGTDVGVEAIAFEVLFEDVPRRHRDGLRPGVRLTGLWAEAVAADGAGFDVDDRVPDEGGATYRVERS
ncbi:MAG TPA: sigma-70 family RNA polymerase sigma factor [Actinomycetota bacterium]